MVRRSTPLTNLDNSPGPTTIRVGDLDHAVGTAIGPGASAVVTVYSGAGDPEQERDRRTLLSGVRSYWVDGVLAASTRGATWIELDKLITSGPLVRAKDVGVDPENRPDPLPPRGATLRQIFQSLARMLLIVGDQGSGKTTTLLALARELLDQAAAPNLTEPMPVVINLATWTTNRQRLEPWLVAELREKYIIAAKTARRWIDGRDLTLLLDGLDEVHVDHRVSCVQAINAFREEHAAGIVVCCRTADYTGLEHQLNVGGTLHLQGLTAEQIQTYIRGSAGAVPAEVLERALREDAGLFELAQTPLMLRLLTSLPRPALGGDHAPASARRAHLLESYVQRCLRDDDANSADSARLDRRSVEWLARGMARHGQSVFLIESLQPDWLASRRGAGLHGASSDAFTVFVVVATVVLTWYLTGSLRGGPAAVQVSPVSVALAGAIAIVIAAAVGFARGASGRLTIKPVEAIGWSRRSAVAGLWRGAVLGFAVGAIGAVAATLPALRTSPDAALPIAVLDVAIGFTFAIVFGVFGALIGGWTPRSIAEHVRPNQGIRQSIRSAAIAGAESFGILSLVWLVVLFVPRNAPGSALEGWLTAVVTWLAVPVIVASRAGGVAAIQHFVLRALLSREPAVPWDLTRLLDLATEKRLMQKAGGGYLFVHRLLRDHLAHM